MMKKRYLLLLSLLMTFTLTGCNQQVEKASSKQSVTLSLEQTSSQDVDVYVDQDQIDTLKSQGAGTYELKLTKGNHELKVVQDGEETQKSFYVDSKETLHYQITKTLLLQCMYFVLFILLQEQKKAFTAFNLLYGIVYFIHF